MGIINMIETIKLIHKEDIVLVKIGTPVSEVLEQLKIKENSVIVT